jgi:hypothetical protein
MNVEMGTTDWIRRVGRVRRHTIRVEGVRVSWEWDGMSGGGDYRVNGFAVRNPPDGVEVREHRTWDPEPDARRWSAVATLASEADAQALADALPTGT